MAQMQLRKLELDPARSSGMDLPRLADLDHELGIGIDDLPEV